MSNETFDILLIEDNPADVAFIEEMLQDSKDFSYTLTWVDNLTKGIIKLKESTFNVILSDISLPDNDGLEIIDKIKAAVSSTPLIILTGLADIDVGVSAVGKGAQDYLVKGNINTDLLIRSINYSIKRKQIELQLADLNNRLNNMVEQSRFQRRF